jgi:membrane protease YdiL (CAAX protease family)
MFKKSRALYHHERITRADLGKAAYEVFIRIPFGTALPEELIFRGALLSILSRHHRAGLAAGVTSCFFGLSHIAPALKRRQRTFQTNTGGHDTTLRDDTTFVATSIVATTAAGLLLAWLRYRSGSIVAPWIAHCAANAAGYTAGWLALRRSSESVVAPDGARLAQRFEPA